MKKILVNIHIKNKYNVLASNNVKYLKKIFTFTKYGVGLIEIKHKKDYNFSLMNQYGSFTISKSFIIPDFSSENKDLIPFTIITPYGLQFVINAKNKIRESDRIISEERKQKQEQLRFLHSLLPFIDIDLNPCNEIFLLEDLGDI